MAEWTFNGAPVLEGRLSLPRSGAWQARVSVDADEAPARGAAVVVSLGATSFRGTVFRAGKPYGRVDALVVGGAGGLAKELAPQAFRNATLRIVVSDALGLAGETLSAASEAAMLGAIVPAWVRARGTTADALTGALGPFGGTWRVGADGTVWVGKDAWPASKAAGLRVDDVPGLAFRVYALDSFDLFAGETFDGGRVSRVEHTTGAERGRATVWFDP